jgi:hypothetical protein
MQARANQMGSTAEGDRQAKEADNYAAWEKNLPKDTVHPIPTVLYEGRIEPKPPVFAGKKLDEITYSYKPDTIRTMELRPEDKPMKDWIVKRPVTVANNPGPDLTKVAPSYPDKDRLSDLTGYAGPAKEENTSGDDIVPQFTLSANGSPREQLLAIAAGAVLKQRNHTYGAPEDAFGRVAALWTALHPDRPAFEKHEVALMIGMVKVARLMENPTHKDSWADLAGYAACGYEAAINEAIDMLVPK